MEATTASPVASAFERWANGEMSCHYAQPCPDELMNFLVDRIWADLEEMAAVPAANAEELLLKIFPLLLATYEPKKDEPPMLPSHGEGNNGSPGLLAAVIADLRRISPEIAQCLAVPNSLDRARAA